MKNSYYIARNGLTGCYFDGKSFDAPIQSAAVVLTKFDLPVVKATWENVEFDTLTSDLSVSSSSSGKFEVTKRWYTPDFSIIHTEVRTFDAEEMWG